MRFKNLILISFLLLTIGCSSNISNKNLIRISGSNTMLELTRLLAEQFMKENQGTSIKVDGIGTAAGIRSLLKGDADICTASRNLSPAEAKELADYYSSLGLVFLIAKDALSIYTNISNRVNNLSTEQLKNIYESKVDNWKYLGGLDTSIQVVTRNPNSGTYFYFKEHVLDGEDYTSNSVVLSTTKEVIQFIEEHSNAIGYGGMGYSGNFNKIKVDGIQPIEVNVINDSYPLSRYLHFFTTKTPSGEIKRFIDWVLSPEGQSIVRKSGFIPLWENKL